MQLFGDERINIVGWGEYNDGKDEAYYVLTAMNDLDIKFQNISSKLSKYGESNFYKSNNDAIYALNDDVYNLANSHEIIEYICEKDRGFRKDVSKITDKICTVDTKDFKTKNTLGLYVEIIEETSTSYNSQTHNSSQLKGSKLLDELTLNDFIGLDKISATESRYMARGATAIISTKTVRQTDPYFAAVFREGYDALVAQGLTGSGEEEFTYEDYASMYLPNEQAYERYSGEWASIWSAGFESFFGIGYFWKAISGKDPITKDILNEGEQKNAVGWGAFELGTSILSLVGGMKLGQKGFNLKRAFSWFVSEGVGGSLAAMTYESAILSGESVWNAGILAFISGVMSGCALDDLISNSNDSLKKLGKQLSKSSDEMEEIMVGLKRLAADNNFSSVDEMLDAALNNPTRLSAGLYDDIIEVIDGPMKSFDLSGTEGFFVKNMDEMASSADDVIEGGSKSIPNVKNATINPKKLTEYALNPNHPVGGNKAKVFESALGYNQLNADDLMQQIYERLPNSEAVLGKLDEYGQRYTVDMLITGPNGKTVTVRTGWIIKEGSDIPELTTLWVND